MAVIVLPDADGAVVFAFVGEAHELDSVAHLHGQFFDSVHFIQDITGSVVYVTSFLLRKRRFGNRDKWFLHSELAIDGDFL